jgi:hypothetical protein
MLVSFGNDLLENLTKYKYQQGTQDTKSGNKRVLRDLSSETISKQNESKHNKTNSVMRFMAQCIKNPWIGIAADIHVLKMCMHACSNH